jgi:fumarate reductase subunit D
MAVSNKPLIWLPFAAGGMLAALLMPAIMLIFLLDGLGMLAPAALDHARVLGVLSQPLVAVAVFATITLILWHAAHRLRMTVQDLGVRNPGPRRWLAWICYLLATVGTVALAAALIAL